MIVCSCNVVSERDIEECVTAFLEEDPWQFVTAGKVYREMEKRGRCCACFPGVVDIIVRVSEEHHRLLASPETKVIDFMARIKEQKGKMLSVQNHVVPRKTSVSRAG